VGFARGRANDFRGVRVNNFIVGFAERGEQVLSAPLDNVSFVAHPEGSSPTTVGEYQIEIRMGASTLSPIRTFDTNDRLAEQITLVAPAGSNIHDGQAFWISDGVNTVTFEYDDVTLPPGHAEIGVEPGRIRVSFDPMWSDHRVAAEIRDRINSAAVQGVLKVRAGLSDGVASGLTSTSNLINLYGSAVGDRRGGLDFGEIIDADAGLTSVIQHGIDTRARYDLGDQNRHREQGQMLIHSNIITHSGQYGIVVDAGLRGTTRHGNLAQYAQEASGSRYYGGNLGLLEGAGAGLAHPGSGAQSARVQCAAASSRGDRDEQRPGVRRHRRHPVQRRQHWHASGAGAVRADREQYGVRQRAQRRGIRVEQNAGPTLLNNVVANLGVGFKSIPRRVRRRWSARRCTKGTGRTPTPGATIGCGRFPDPDLLARASRCS
jgi:hypothetical protein